MPSALPRPLFSLALALLAAAAVPISIIAFNWGGEDCYITYRYARNLAEGHGIVFNTTDETADDRVEGYSNPTLILLLALIHRLGGDIPSASRWIATIAAAMTVWLLGRFGSAWSDERRPCAGDLIAPALYALHPLVHYQAGRALETTLYAMLITLAALWWVRGWTVATSVVLALVAASRPEGFTFIAPFLAVWAALMIFPVLRASDLEPTPPSSGVGLGGLVKLVLPWALLVAGLFLWRRSYYGQWMPNAVHLKAGPSNPSALPEVRDFIIAWSFLPLLIPFAYSGLTSAPPRLRRGLIIVALLMLHQLAFILAVGRVPAEPNRHFIPIVPFACLCIARTAVIASRAFPGRLIRAFGLAALLGLNLFTVNNGDGSRTRLHVRLREFLRNYGGGWNSLVAQWRFHWEWFHHPEIRIDSEAGRWVDAHLPPGALIAADQMGQFAYHCRQPMLDMFGLMDEHIARAGLDVGYILAHSPDFVVFMYQLYPPVGYTPYQQPLRDDARFQASYRPRWRLRQNLPTPYAPYEFHVWVRHDLDDGAPFEWVVLPGTVEAADHWWRARDFPVNWLQKADTAIQSSKATRR